MRSARSKLYSLYHPATSEYKKSVDYYKDRDWHKQLSHTHPRRSKKPFVVIILIILLLIAGVAAYWWFASHKVTSPSANNQPTLVDHKTLDNIPLRDRVAGLFLLHTPSTDPQVLADYYQKYKPAGLIFMDDNIPATRADLQAETTILTAKGELPPFIAIDEEGDSVKRLNSDTFPGAWTLADLPPAATKDAFTKRSDLLKGFGFNLNFGIVADETDNQKSYIFQRVLGTTPQAAANRVAQAVLGTKGLTLSTLKHFPGHGETTANSHVSIPTAFTTMKDWQAGSMLPFKSGIDAGADLVMFGHLRFTAVDSQPASLSKTWHDTLRSKLGFKGLTITDDMVMLQSSGDKTLADPIANAIAALKAGNDLLLYVLNHDSDESQIDPNKLIDGVVTAVKDGRVSQDIIDQRYQAVINIRQKLADR